MIILRISYCLLLLISISSCNSKRKPKIGEVVYDVPSLFNKDVDEIMRIFNKSYDTYQDTIVPNEKNKVFLRDETSGITEGYWPGGNGLFFFNKDGWTFGIAYNIKTRKISSISIGSNVPAFEHLCLNNVQELLQIGNLNKDSQDYDLTFQDCFLAEFSLHDKQHPNEFGSVSVNLKNKNLEIR